MKAEYDLSKLRARKNPFATRLKKPVTVRMSEDVLSYFKNMADEVGVPYQSLMNLYLRDCIARGRKVRIPRAKKSRPHIRTKRVGAQSSCTVKTAQEDQS